MQLFFDSLENEPVSVSYPGVYTTAEKKQVSGRNIYWLQLLLVKIENTDTNKRNSEIENLNV